MPDVTVQFDTKNSFIAETAEIENNFKAGFISNNGLVCALGITTEREQGYMVVQGVQNWYAKLSGTYPINPAYPIDGNSAEGNWPRGASAGWADGWHAVNTYLQYGGMVCIAGTGSNINTISPKETLKSPDLEFGAIFGATAENNTDLTEIATERGDCVAICALAVTGDIGTDITKVDAPLGTSGDKYTFYVAGSKYHLKDNALIASSQDINNLQLTPLTADVAGCFARTNSTAQPWSSPAGFSRGRILSVVRLQQPLTKSSADTLYANNINPIKTFPGEGSFLFGDKTRRQPSENENFAHVNVTNLVVYLRKVLSSIANKYLFELNDESNRNSFINRSTPILRSVLNSGGITEFKIVCDTTNNPPSVVDNQQFVADLYIKETQTIQEIQIRFTNVLANESVLGSINGSSLTDPARSGYDTGPL